MNFNKLNHTYIVAEIGVNHNGSLDLANKLATKDLKSNYLFIAFSGESVCTKIESKYSLISILSG